MTRSVVLVVGGAARWRPRHLMPVIERVLQDGHTLVLVSAPKPTTVPEAPGLTLVSLCPDRWRPDGPRTKPRPPRELGRLEAWRERRRLARYPEYAEGAETWEWARDHAQLWEALAGADLVVAGNGAAIRTVWEIGNQLPEPAVVFGMWGVETILESWRLEAGSGAGDPGS
jgi:hypothetical protein